MHQSWVIYLFLYGVRPTTPLFLWYVSCCILYWPVDQQGNWSLPHNYSPFHQWWVELGQHSTTSEMPETHTLVNIHVFLPSYWKLLKNGTSLMNEWAVSMTMLLTWEWQWKSLDGRMYMCMLLRAHAATGSQQGMTASPQRVQHTSLLVILNIALLPSKPWRRSSNN